MPECTDDGGRASLQAVRDRRSEPPGRTGEGEGEDSHPHPQTHLSGGHRVEGGELVRGSISGLLSKCSLLIKTEKNNATWDKLRLCFTVH